ncbi:chemotaxis protein CheW [Algicola sagamiensis]|uniref:chemotaxis protein CheW n=1 Tax=Algicola sagamiensis TaxID=163869 RepID=UPI00037BCB09|nr:chemotaxis protein CheW [Algicola sagamiensis]
MDEDKASLTSRDQASGGLIQVLTCFGGDRIVGFRLSSISEVIEYTIMTQVPHMPPVLEGFVNLRGTELPVIDLNRQLGGCDMPLTRKTCIIIVATEYQGEKIEFGIKVDGVCQLLSVKEEHVLDPQTMGGQLPIAFVDFMIDLGADDEALLVLKIDKVMDLSDLVETDHANH